jgi:alanine racemase
MDDLQKRTWAEVNLDHLVYNYKAMKARLKEGTRFLGVVKANAYGHGAVAVSKTLEAAGCDYLAVASLDEAVQLRESGIQLPILILGYTFPQYTDRLLTYRVIQAVGSYEMAREMSEIAVKLGQKLTVHLKVDSGMGRLGFTCHHGEDPVPDLIRIATLPGLEIEGIFTHFAVSDILGDTYTANQFAAFSDMIDRFEAGWGKRVRIRHCTNSGAMINYPWTYMDMVRPGISLYGLYPDKEKGDITLRPVMELKTRVVQIKEFAPGYTVSYGRTYVAPERRRIAVLPIGYADGLHRVLSNQMDVLVRGQRAHQVGRICMDMCMIDVTDIPETVVGDPVTIFGRDGGAFIPVEELAAAAGTISYELLCAVDKRVPRVYIKNGTFCQELTYNMNGRELL